MKIEQIKQILQEKKKVKFKMYSLDYIIEDNNGIFQIYSTLYTNHIKKYNSIDELLFNFTIYNEPIIDNESRIENIEFPENNK